MTKDEALKLALDALEAAYARIVTKCEQNLVTYNGVDVDTLTLSIEAITAIKKVLAQEQEPVAWEQFYPDIGKPQIAFNAEVIGYVAPQRTWVGLMRGVRVEGDTLVITVKGGNDVARELCGALIEEMNK